MSGWMRLVWRYVSFNWGKTLVLVLCVWLTVLLPVTVSILLRQFSLRIVSRAESTPAIVGRVGSDLDLALHGIYFRRRVDGTVPVSQLATIRESGLARPVPVFCRFTARQYPLVGTNLDYFDFRQLEVGAGRMFVRLGECVIGSGVARATGLGPGDELLSDRENVLDPAGLYPLKMKITGVLSASNPTDDAAVFTDLKTAWVVQGLGHGHQDLSGVTDENLVQRRDGNGIVARATVLPYTAITDENIASFHFHGDTADFPLTAILIDSPDEKSATILEGRYPSADGSLQLVVPRDEIAELLGVMFQTERFFMANSVLIALSTALLMGLVVLLSLRLRRAEMDTFFKLGCSRWTVVGLQTGELLLVVFLAAGLVAAAVWSVQRYAGDLLERMVLQG